MTADHLERRYEALRSEHGLAWLMPDSVDAELCFLERIFPDSYQYPGDPPLDSPAAITDSIWCCLDT